MASFKIGELNQWQECRAKANNNTITGSVASSVYYHENMGHLCLLTLPIDCTSPGLTLGLLCCAVGLLCRTVAVLCCAIQDCCAAEGTGAAA